MSNQQCEGAIGKPPNLTQCPNTGKYKEDGLHYCGKHSPKRQEARQKKRDDDFLIKVRPKLNKWLAHARKIARGNYVDSTEKFLVINRKVNPPHLQHMPTPERLKPEEMAILISAGLVKPHTYHKTHGAQSITARDYIWVEMSTRLI